MIDPSIAALQRGANVAFLIDEVRASIVTAIRIAIFALATGSALAQVEPITATATVIDGDTLEIHGVRIRLQGVDAPESSQQCTDAAGAIYLCGSRAALALSDFINRRPVECFEVDRDQYRRMVARCEVGGANLSKWLVQQGWALDWPRYSKGACAPEQAEARTAGRGIWVGKFVAPWNYRACVRNGKRNSECSGLD
jgi:endonuclease YncB( thermonuclease family)